MKYFRRLFFIFLFSLIIFPQPSFAQEERMKVLIVPGHDFQSFGAIYRGLKEEKVNTELGEILFSFLEKDPLFLPTIVRDTSGYSDVFLDFFKEEEKSILKFQKEVKDNLEESLENGNLKKNQNIQHNRASSDTAFKLYGINKWAEEDDVDVILHIHFNDYRRNNINNRGDYTGFSIYVPERQFQNADTSFILAESIFSRLQRYFPQSNLPLEEEGIIESQSLIAMGGGALSAPVVLLEYGYIYDFYLQQQELRETALTELALQTYIGIKDYLFGSISVRNDASFTETSLFPYEFKKTLRMGTNYEKEVFILQAILIEEGLYFKDDENKERCLIDGMFGSCTYKGLRALQDKYQIGERGFVGSRTREFLSNYAID